MAGKSSKGRSRKGTNNNNNNNNNNSNNNIASDDFPNSSEHVPAKDNATEANSEHEKPEAAESTVSSNPDKVNEHETPNAETQQKQGQPH